LIAALEDLGVLVEEIGWQRNRLFAFRRYLDVFLEEE
jgi:hypothetical protein